MAGFSIRLIGDIVTGHTALDGHYFPYSVSRSKLAVAVIETVQDQGMHSYSTVMTDHPVWMPDGEDILRGTDLDRAVAGRAHRPGEWLDLAAKGEAVDEASKRSWGDSGPAGRP